MDEIDVCRHAIASDLRKLGVGDGHVMMVHSSFKALGPVPGGIETLVCALLDAVGESGTLLMPGLCWDLRPPTVFDVRSTPVNVGAVPEYFRTRVRTLRSLHPTHSVCGIGADAERLLAGHEQDRTPCGPNSAYQKITEFPAKVVMLGCGLGSNTMMHALEECVENRRFLGGSVSFTFIGWDGEQREGVYRTHDFGTYQQRYDRVIELDGDFLRTGKVLQAETFVMDTVGLREVVLAKLEDDPYCFVESAEG